ncbi:hypothetical protein ACOMHN_008423 [Nucella lapillus]
MFVSMWHVEAANIKVFSVLQLQFGPQYLAVCGQFRLFNRVSACYVSLAVGTRIIRLLSKFIGRRFPVDVKKYGRWAVVTGCTEGIGKSYALQLAEKGIDMVLVSRNPQKLSAVAEHIVQQYQVSVKVITADFRNTDVYDGIKKQLSGLDIGILVNNVGIINLLTPGYFCDADDFEQFHRDIVNVNVLSYLMMTGIVLPEMLERKRGAIINISSIAGLRPMPFSSVYSATKSYRKKFRLSAGGDPGHDPDRYDGTALQGDQHRKLFLRQG